MLIIKICNRRLKNVIRISIRLIIYLAKTRFLYILIKFMTIGKIKKKEHLSKNKIINNSNNNNNNENNKEKDNKNLKIIRRINIFIIIL